MARPGFGDLGGLEVEALGLLGFKVFLGFRLRGFGVQGIGFGIEALGLLGFKVSWGFRGFGV